MDSRIRAPIHPTMIFYKMETPFPKNQRLLLMKMLKKKRSLIRRYCPLSLRKRKNPFGKEEEVGKQKKKRKNSKSKIQSKRMLIRLHIFLSFHNRYL